MLSGDAITNLVTEAKKCKYTLIPTTLSVEGTRDITAFSNDSIQPTGFHNCLICKTLFSDVINVWDGVAAFITRQLVQPKVTSPLLTPTN